MVVVDRVLLARAITNMIETRCRTPCRARTLTIKAEATSVHCGCRSPTPALGWYPEALRRIFEPYFSTKATGTGLGSTIAKTQCGIAWRTDIRGIGRQARGPG